MIIFTRLKLIMMEEEINNRFYQAFQSLSIEQMDRIWDNGDDIVCLHPGWELFTGWLAIRESWVTIFQNTTSIKFLITITKVHLPNDLVISVCLENIKSVMGHNAISSGIPYKHFQKV
jgi:hypothetical protein